MATTTHDDGEPPDPRASTDSQTHLLTPSPSPSSPLLPPSQHDTDPLAMAPEDSADQDPAHGLSAEEARRVLRRIDRRVIPLLFLASALTFMDKTILSSAAVFGLRADTGLSGGEYSWVSSAFYLGYLVATYPATRLAARLPVAKYLGVNSLFWGTVVALTAACGGFGGVFTARFALGLAEAAVAPCQVFVTGAWYVRDEIPARTGVWFAGNSVGGIVSSLLAFGVGSGVQHGAWRWMFAILGILTFVFGGVVLAFLPDSISTARFLTAEEKKWARDRVVVAGLGATEKKPWRWDQMRECLVDPKTWMVWALALLCQIPNGGTQNFANIVITSFGFSPLQSTLINIPYSVLGFATITGSGWVAGRL
ncbi:major facilitator superfamily domain-containing protein [Nemania diffusa]|nr:major facilitator superfamily domain-containing protein [Nemania diffusa]